jgi:hypothetical protein
MGTITVAIDGESIFTWDGDEAAVKHVLEDFRTALLVLA